MYMYMLNAQTLMVGGLGMVGGLLATELPLDDDDDDDNDDHDDDCDDVMNTTIEMLHLNLLRASKHPTRSLEGYKIGCAVPFAF